MSKYTTEVRFICESSAKLDNSVGGNAVDEVIDLSLKTIFNFDFPVFDESYRKVLEHKILKHYYTREIAFETVGLWKLKLNTKLNEIMPYYNKLYMSELIEFNPLYSHNITRKRNGNVQNTSDTITDGNIKSTSETNGRDFGNTYSSTKDLYSDTPQGSIANLEAETYLTNARNIADTGNSDTTTEATTETDVTTKDNTNKKDNTIENYLETIVGYEGRNASDMILKYRETFLNIDLMVINELEDLFFQLW